MGVIRASAIGDSTRTMKTSNLMILHTRIEQRGELSVCITPFFFEGTTHELEFSVQTEFEDFLSDRADGPFLALLMLGMLTGSDIQVEGPLSPRLYNAFSHNGQELIRRVIPELKRVNISANALIPNPIKGESVATAFSAGVDSFHTINQYFFDNPAPQMRITHLSFANVGAHLNLGEKLHYQRYKKHLPFAQKNQLPFLSINSNISDFYVGRIHILLNVSLLNSAAALSIQNGLSYYYMAGTRDYDGMHFNKTNDISSIEGALIPLFATESLDFLLTGSEIGRLEKTRYIADLPDAQQFLEVCPFEAGNCSKCFKCMRTMITLDLLGKLDQFKQVFDIDHYHASKQNYLYSLYIPEADAPLKKKIRQYAVNIGYHFSWKTRIWGRIIGLKYLAYVARKKLLRRLRGQSRSISKYHKLS